MTIPFAKIFKYLFFISALIFLLFLFIPRTYDVPPFKERADTKYWELKTGSKIGYTLLNRKGPVDKPPIIYLHGGPGGIVSNSTIKLFQPLTEKGFDVYLYDQIGSGHSNRLESIDQYSVERHKRDLEEIINLIGTEKVILFGQSWGAMLAVEYLAEHKEKVDRMIFSGPGPILPINQQLRSLAAPDSLNLIEPKFSNAEANQNTYTLRSKWIDFWAHRVQSKLASDKEVDGFFTVLNKQLDKSTTCDGQLNTTYKAGLGYYSHLMTVRSISDVIDKRNKIIGNTTPLLILKGQCDNQKWGFTQEYLNLFPNSEIKIIESGGHRIEEARYLEYMEIISQFLK